MRPGVATLVLEMDIASAELANETRWQQISTPQQLDQALRELQGAQVALVQFKASWCKKCAVVANELKERIGDDVVWLGVDIEELEELALRFNVTKMPRFDVYSEGHAKSSLEGHGVSTNAILQAIEEASRSRPQLDLDADF